MQAQHRCRTHLMSTCAAKDACSWRQWGNGKANENWWQWQKAKHHHPQSQFPNGPNNVHQKRFSISWNENQCFGSSLDACATGTSISLHSSINDKTASHSMAVRCPPSCNSASRNANSINPSSPHLLLLGSFSLRKRTNDYLWVLLSFRFLAWTAVVDVAALFCFALLYTCCRFHSALMWRFCHYQATLPALRYCHGHRLTLLLCFGFCLVLLIAAKAAK